jgi:ATP-dependent helicase/nuclease subunit A
VDSLLMVTFTKAAAAQMRERISEALAKRIAENPGDTRLVRQQMLLPFAHICTIDSFCNELVRENFHLLDLNPDYKIMDESEVNIIREDAAATVIEALYEENAPETRELVELLIQGNDDRVLTDSIIRLYTQAEAYPFPDSWLQSLLAPFENIEPVEQSEWGKIIIEYVTEGLAYCRDASRSMLEYIKNDETVENSYTATFSADIGLYERLLAKLKNATWDEMMAAMQSAAFERIGSLPRKFESPVKDKAQAVRDKLKKTLKEKLAGAFVASSDEHLEDMAYLKPIVCKLIEAVLLFKAKFAEMKSEVNSADFADISHKALELLIEKDEQGNIKKTALAEELSQRYTEILVDEYQDINKAQDMLFSALSKDEQNLFMVGDVKQSIYRFRQAMPEIFLNRRNSLPLYLNENYPARIVLGSNFRSRDGITGAANFIFSQIMSIAVGELDYNEEEALVPAAEYPVAAAPDTEIHIIDATDGFEDSKDNAEARYIAEMINEMILSGLTVADKKGERRAEYRDFCVLLRSTRNKASIYIDELAKHNVPAYSELSGGFFEAQEVGFMLALMRILDNPVQDVPLLTVLLSPVFGFTPDELARLRINDRRAPIYNCLIKAQAQGSKKCKEFLSQIEELRRLSSTLAAGELVRHLLEETGYLAIAGAMSGGSQRRANLHLLLDYANKYEAAGHIGLSGFIRFIDKLEGGNSDLTPAVELSEAANVVRVMSIHKSKGLEFPVCILSNCSAKFNTESQKGNIVINPRAGIGLRRRDIETFRQFDTVSQRAAALATEQAERSEELRVLYVALTRAKERLITVMSIKNPENRLSALAGVIGNTAKIAPFAVRGFGSLSDWILTAALRHPDAVVLRELAGADSSIVLPAGFPLKIVCKKEETVLAEDEINDEKTEPSQELIEIIKERLSYVYPYAALSAVIAKRAASELEEHGINREYFAASRPAFLNKGGLTPAQRGTAIHKFMQYADYTAARTSAATERDRLVEMGFLSELEGTAVDLAKINTFFQSGLAQRIFSAEKLMREQKFAIRIPARELYPELPENAEDEAIVVQGIADCAFVENGELVILDYKTDRGVTLEMLAERYKGQLAIYKRALEECLEIKVKETLLYSFELGASVAV